MPRSNIPRTSPTAILIGSLVLLDAALGLILCFRGSEFSFHGLFAGARQLPDFFTRMLPPDWSIADVLWTASIETMQITAAGTFVGALFAYPLGLLGAAGWTRPWVYVPVKALMALIRSIPLLLLALLFVALVGLGPFAGMLAIAFHSTGVLGRFVAEEIENVDLRPIRAIAGTGASPLQVLQHGLVPQVLPQMIAHLAIRFEMNLRESTILGLVGAGGLGYYISLYIRQFQWPRVGPLLLAVVALVFAAEVVTLQVRRRLL